MNEIAKNKQLARNYAYKSILNLITSGDLKAGTFIAEEHISEKLGISRTPVRAALLMLDSDKIIEIIPNRGAMVREIKLKEIIEIYDVRTMIEKKSAHLICLQNLRLADRVYQIIEEISQPIDALSFTELDLEFHRSLVKSSLNEVLLNTYDSIGARAMQASLKIASRNKSHQVEEIAQHKQIIRAIEAKDPDMACKILNKHLAVTDSMILA